MPQDPAPMDQLRDEPLRFLETEQFQEMLSVYRKLKPLEQENPRYILLPELQHIPIISLTFPFHSPSSRSASRDSGGLTYL